MLACCPFISFTHSWRIDVLADWRIIFARWCEFSSAQSHRIPTDQWWTIPKNKTKTWVLQLVFQPSVLFPLHPKMSTHPLTIPLSPGRYWRARWTRISSLRYSYSAQLDWIERFYLSIAYTDHKKLFVCVYVCRVCVRARVRACVWNGVRKGLLSLDFCLKRAWKVDSFSQGLVT